MKKLLSFIFLTPLTALAQVDPDCPPGTTDTTLDCIPETLAGGAGDLVRLVETIGNWVFTFLIALAVVFILIAAYKYMTSGGGDDVSKAHKMLAYAAVGILIGFLAQGIVNVIKQLVIPNSVPPAAGSPAGPGGPSGPGAAGSPAGPGGPTAPLAGSYHALGANTGLTVQVCNDRTIPGVNARDVGLAIYGGTCQRAGATHANACSWADVPVAGLGTVEAQACPDNGTLPDVRYTTPTGGAAPTNPAPPTRRGSPSGPTRTPPPSPSGGSPSAGSIFAHSDNVAVRICSDGTIPGVNTKNSTNPSGEIFTGNCSANPGDHRLACQWISTSVQGLGLITAQACPKDGSIPRVIYTP